MSLLIFLFLLSVALFVPFRIVCFFKRTCKWKKCPFRRVGYLGDGNMGGCSKCPFPYDDKEKEKVRAEIEKLKTLIQQNNQK